jgi:hypothetical protein
MKQRFSFLLLVILIGFNLIAQKYDNIWLLGYNGQNPHPDLGGMVVNFDSDPPNIIKELREMNFDMTNASICDENGNLLMYANNIYIANANDEPIDNGEGLNPADYTNDFANNGYRLPQGAIFLPQPDHDSIFFLFHEPLEYSTPDLSIHAPKLYYSKINTNENNGLGVVIEKNQTLVEDTLALGKLTATKHANGRDWWIIVAEYDKYRFYTFLLNQNGIIDYGLQNPQPDTSYGRGAIGQAVFSPNGSKYIRHQLRGFPAGHFLDIYDFDRCDGTLSNYVHIPLADTAGIGGVAVSPNSRFLYVTSDEVVYQFDLTVADIENTKEVVAEFDGFESPFPTQFYLAQLAPNGKIYISAPSSNNVLHVINLPNHQGTDCQFMQHGVDLPTLNNNGIPNFPNYRLGALDGSPCDTLGIDNHPLAGFTCEPEALTITFSDNSYYAPTDWFWDFGDNGTSDEQNPIYTYSEEGTYQICLTVSNDFDSDTFCKTVTVTTTNTKNLASDISFELYPNPTSDRVFVSVQSPTSQSLSLQITNLLGEVMTTVSLSSGMFNQEISLESFASGTYFYQLLGEEQVFDSGKLLLIK